MLYGKDKEFYMFMEIKMKRMSILIVVISLLVSANSFSQEDWFSMPEDETYEQSGIHNHHIGLFLGAVSNLQNGKVGFATGLDYTYFFEESEPLVGLGGLFEVAFADHSEIILGPLFTLQPWHEIKCFVAPSVVFIDIHDKEIDEIHETSDIKFLLRFGTAYMFHIDNWSISPTISADIMGSKVSLVYGISVGFGF